MKDRIAPNRLFKRTEENGRTFENIPIVISDSVEISHSDLLQSVKHKFHFSGHPGTAKFCLSDLHENEIVEIAIQNENVRAFVISELGFNPKEAWCWVGAPRKLLFPDNPDGKPGDFDLIVGPIRNGLICFDQVGIVEVKIRKVSSDGDARSFPSGTGTAQAKGAAELGFDRTLLLHLLVQDEKDDVPGAPTSWRSINAGADFSSGAMQACAGKIRDIEAAAGIDAPYGYALLGFGQISGTDPSRACAVSPIPVRRAPFRPLKYRSTERWNRLNLHRSLEKQLSNRRPGSLFLRICTSCNRVFSSNSSRDRSCCCSI